jgi:hypothetical protein
MTGAIPLLPLYAFMTWKGKKICFESVQIGSGACPASYYVGTAVCLFGIKRPGRVFHQLPSSVAEVKESTEQCFHGQLYRCYNAYSPLVRGLIRSICSVNIYIFALFFQACYTPFFVAWNMQSFYENPDIL